MKGCWILSLWVVLMASMALSQDSIAFKRDADWHDDKQIKISLEYNTPHPTFRFLPRYIILNDYSFEDRFLTIYRNVQKFLISHNRLSYSVTENYSYLKDMDLSALSLAIRPGNHDLQFAVWRTKLATIQNDKALPPLVQSGMDLLLQDTSIKWPDYFLFVNQLMQEHYDYYYDYQRVKPDKATTGVVLGVTDMLRLYRPFEGKEVAGVCRDIHDTGLRLLRLVGQQYFDQHYPEKNINIDKHLYLVSWVTQSSHHVTLLAEDPLSPNTRYELDWGRLIKTTNVWGYDHGRNYGNVYRIWQYDANADVTKAIDFRKTAYGQVMDRNLYNENELFELSGPVHNEYFSQLQINYRHADNQIKVATGELSALQKFALLSYDHRSQWHNILFSTSSIFSLQSMWVDDVKKKNIMFPGYDFELSRVWMVMPRLYARFNSRPIYLIDHLSLDLFGTTALELFANNNFTRAQLRSYGETSGSGDMGFYFTQGARLSFQKIPAWQASLSWQNRSFAIPNDVRRMTIDPSVLFSHLVFVHAAQDWMLSLSASNPDGTAAKLLVILEKNISGSTYASWQGKFTVPVTQQHELNVGFSGFRQCSGRTLFWYQPNMWSFSTGLSHKTTGCSANLHFRQYPQQGWQAGISVQYQH